LIRGIVNVLIHKISEANRGSNAASDKPEDGFISSQARKNENPHKVAQDAANYLGQENNLFISLAKQ